MPPEEPQQQSTTSFFGRGIPGLTFFGILVALFDGLIAYNIVQVTSEELGWLIFGYAIPFIAVNAIFILLALFRYIRRSPDAPPKTLFVLVFFLVASVYPLFYFGHVVGYVDDFQRGRQVTFVKGEIEADHQKHYTYEPYGLKFLYPADWNLVIDREGSIEITSLNRKDLHGGMRGLSLYIRPLNSVPMSPIELSDKLRSYRQAAIGSNGDLGEYAGEEIIGGESFPYFRGFGLSIDLSSGDEFVPRAYLFANRGILFAAEFWINSSQPQNGAQAFFVSLIKSIEFK